MTLGIFPNSSVISLSAYPAAVKLSLITYIMIFDFLKMSIKIIVLLLFCLNIRLIYIRAQVDGEFWHLSHDSCLSHLCVLLAQHLSRIALPDLSVVCPLPF